MTRGSAHDDVAEAVCGVLVMAARATMHEIPFVPAFFVGTPRYIPAQRSSW
jgi:hypothetical protein